jgi:nicotinate-nucleotide adenylyltransferase
MSSGSSDTPSRLGIYGGTFDPPHLGHLILAETAADNLHLARVIFAPVADPPHKGPRDVHAPAEDRLAMTGRAIADNPRFALSRVDMDRPGPQYSVDTLRLLREDYPGADLYFLIGADSLRDLPAWSRPAELIQLARLGVVHRRSVETDLESLEVKVPGISRRITWIDAPRIEIASHVLIEQIAAGRSVRYQVPDAVYEYIKTHRLYGK